MLFSMRASSFHMPIKRYPKQQMYKLQQNNAKNMKKRNNMTSTKKKNQDPSSPALIDPGIG